MSDIVERLNAGLSGRYRVDGELGQGGMAIVYQAQDLRHERDVAIKVLRPEIGTEVGAERFLQEIRIAARLIHPHILPLYASGEVEGLLYYVMPNMKGSSLRDRMDREGQIALADAIRIASEVAGALDYAHRQNVVHRDIKPENILFHDGSALVADFGIGKALTVKTGPVTQTGMALGTPTYMSPEQASGERDLDGRSDLYSL
ncbi:MAG: serine/threonine-protein kinase, partial [Gemmatimonadota bacterium]